MLGQTETARLLQQCEPGTTGMEEVLSSYVIWKYLKGRSTAHILGKLKTLTCFLRVTGQQHILEAGREVFIMIAVECALGGESRIGILPCLTPIGKQLCNRIRRQAKIEGRVSTHQQYGGPIPVQAFLTQEQRDTVSLIGNYDQDRHVRSAWAERHFNRRLEIFNGVLPSYPDRSDGGTLPRYVTSPSNQEQLLSLVATIQQSQSPALDPDE